MPPKKSPKKDDKKDDKKTSKKSSKKSTKEKSKKSSEKSSKVTTTKKKTDSSKKEVKKKPESKPVPKKKIQSKKEVLSDKDSEESDNSSIKSNEESNVTDSDNIKISQDDYENTETKMSEFFSDDDNSQTNEDSEITEIKTETLDSSDPKEVIYDNFLSSQKSKSIDLKIVEQSKRMTNPRMTKYEMVRIIGERTKQFKMGAKPLIKNTDDLTYEEKAILELKKNMTPIKIKRPLPNNTVEIWDISELNKDHLEF